MQFRITTDYAIRCVLYLASNPGCTTARQIGEAVRIPRNYTQQIMGKLRDQNIVSSELGTDWQNRRIKSAFMISSFSLRRHCTSIAVWRMTATATEAAQIESVRFIGALPPCKSILKES